MNAFDRKVSLPYHMHINIELIDICYLISGMVLDLPSIVNA